MRNVLTIGFFVMCWLAMSVMCNLASLVLGLQHPDLPDWWLRSLSTVTGIFCLVVAGVVTWAMRRAARPTPPASPPPFSYPPPPPPPSYPPR